MIYNFLEILNKSLEMTDGDIIEIGAGVGETTYSLLEVAKKYNRRVIVIDPFEDGWNDMPKSYGEPYPYEKFLQNTIRYNDNLLLIKKSSQDIKTEELIKHSPISFSFIDGLQFKESVLHDLNLMKNVNCGIICVDDYTRLTYISQVPLAVEEFLKNNDDYTILCSDNVETRAKVYLIKKELYEKQNF